MFCIAISFTEFLEQTCDTFKTQMYKNKTNDCSFLWTVVITQTRADSYKHLFAPITNQPRQWKSEWNCSRQSFTGPEGLPYSSIALWNIPKHNGWPNVHCHTHLFLPQLCNSKMATHPLSNLYWVYNQQNYSVCFVFSCILPGHSRSWTDITVLYRNRWNFDTDIKCFTMYLVRNELMDEFNQSIKQTINQSVNQSVNQSIDQLIDQSYTAADLHPSTTSSENGFVEYHMILFSIC